MPGPCSPTLLIIPAVVSCTRIGGLPAQGSADRDLTTTAPNEERSRYELSSAPCPAVPEAVMTGVGRTTAPIRVALSAPADIGPEARAPLSFVPPRAGTGEDKSELQA